MASWFFEGTCSLELLGPSHVADVIVAKEALYPKLETGSWFLNLWVFNFGFWTTLRCGLGARTGSAVLSPKAQKSKPSAS